jgi:peptide/nickel transport system permease protein
MGQIGAPDKRRGGAGWGEKKIARHLLAIVVTALVGLLATATLVRLAPGFDVDIQQLDPRLSHQSVEALRAERARNRDLLGFYMGYLASAAHGDFGNSQTLHRPVRELLAERLPETAKIVAYGLLAGWLLAALLAMAGALVRHAAMQVATAGVGSFFLCLPAAVLAMLVVIGRAPPFLAVAMVVFPWVFRYSRNLLARSYARPHIITARAKGLGPFRVLFHHVLPVSAAPLLALAGVSVSLALGAAVPIEALCGIPGIGQLAWPAALGRDLPLLVTLTVLVTLITLVANTMATLLAGSRTANS